MRKILNLLFCLVGILTFTTKVDAASYYSTINANLSSTKYEYIDGLEIYHNKANGYNLYILDADTIYDNYTNLTNPKEVSDGYKYIINKGNATSNSNKNYYITQIALLWYEDYLNGNNDNISSSMKESIKSNTKDTVCYYITKLVNDAKNLVNIDSIKFENDEITFYKEGSYYYSNIVYVTTDNLYSVPTVGLHNAPSGSSIINNNITKDGEGSFQIRIPYNSVYNKDDIDFEVYIKGYDTNNTYYRFTNVNKQDGILAMNYNSGNTQVEASIPVRMVESDNTSVRIKVVDKNNEPIKGIKYNVYKGECGSTTCKEKDLIDTFVTTSSFIDIEPIINAGTYTFVRMTDTNYDLYKVEIVNVNDTTSVQSHLFKEIGEYEDDKYYDDDYDNEDYDNTKSYKIRIYNPSGDNSNVIKIYDNDELLGSFRGNEKNYYINLYPGISYSIIDSNDTMEIFFDVTSDGELYVHEMGKKVKRDYINLDNYVLRYPIKDEYEDSNNKNESNKNDNNKNESNNKNEISKDENGTINIGNLGNNDSIEISQKVETTTDVKIDWISNIIDCPITSVSSTIKYIVGAIILALGIVLTIKNVKKSKNNI